MTIDEATPGYGMPGCRGGNDASLTLYEQEELDRALRYAPQISHGEIVVLAKAYRLQAVALRAALTELERR